MGLQLNKFLKLLENAVVNVAPVLDEKNLGRALHNTLNLIPVLAHFPRCQASRFSGTFEGNGCHSAFSVQAHVDATKVPKLAAPVLKRSLLSHNGCNPILEGGLRYRHVVEP